MSFFKHFKLINKGKSRVYLDFASSTPSDERMLKTAPVIPSYIAGANPSALHTEGVSLSRVLARARADVARVLDVHTDEIIFTSGATESDNMAIVGSVMSFLAKGIQHDEIAVFSSELEHAAVAESIAHLTKWGVHHIPLYAQEGVVSVDGIVFPEGIRAAVITVMYVNNEIGTVQPIALIAKRIRKLRKMHPEIEFVFHTDATQAPLYFPLRVPSLGVDMMTLGATKLYCSKGVGVLYKKRSVSVEPLLYGGGQERGYRPGTPAVALIAEFAHALSYTKEIQEKETHRIQQLQSYFETQIKKLLPDVRISAQTQVRSPHITHVGVPRIDSELLVIELDARGVAVSAKSACKNEEGSESPVVGTLYGNGWGAVRFSFGRTTTKQHLDRALRAFVSVYKKYKNI